MEADFLIDTPGLQISQFEFAIRAFVALGIGFIIGLEREHSALKDEVESFAGIRSFVFIVLLGFLAGVTYFVFSPYVYIVILLAMLVMTVTSYFVTATRGNISVSTELSMLIAFILGTLALAGHIEVSLMITVVVVVLLSAKLRLRSLVGAITAEELYDFIRYVVVALLIFPFLPNEAFGPYQVINPREIGWVVILISGIGFVGYLLMKFLGPRRGILLSAMVGGLISSTGVTWVFAKKSRADDGLAVSCATAILAASSIMVVRVLVWVSLFNEGLFNTIILPVMFVFAVCVAATLYLYFKQRKREVIETNIRQDKPLDLPGAFVFALIYTIILLVVSYANAEMGEKGLMISSAVAGLSDIDAITITVSKLAELTKEYASSANAIFIAMLSNTLVKMGIGVFAGSRAMRKYLISGYALIAIAIVLAILL